jgi:hypothetical protein
MLTLKQAVAASIANGTKASGFHDQAMSSLTLTAEVFVPVLVAGGSPIWSQAREEFFAQFIQHKGWVMPQVQTSGDKSAKAEAARERRKDYSTKCSVYFSRYVVRPCKAYAKANGITLPAREGKGTGEKSKERLAFEHDRMRVNAFTSSELEKGTRVENMAFLARCTRNAKQIRAFLDLPVAAKQKLLKAA